MAKVKTYKVIEDFEYMANRRRKIEKGAVIPEEFFAETFGANAEKMIETLVSLKKIKADGSAKEGVKDEKDNTKSTASK